MPICAQDDIPPFALSEASPVFAWQSVSENQRCSRSSLARSTLRQAQGERGYKPLSPRRTQFRMRGSSARDIIADSNNILFFKPLLGVVLFKYVGFVYIQL